MLRDPSMPMKESHACRTMATRGLRSEGIGTRTSWSVFLKALIKASVGDSPKSSIAARFMCRRSAQYLPTRVRGACTLEDRCFKQWRVHSKVPPALNEWRSA